MKRNRVNVRRLTALTVGLVLVGSWALADWDTAVGRGLIPYWQTGGNWYTMLTFVNTSEETNDLIYISFEDVHGGVWYPPGPSTIRHGEMLIFSTTPEVPIWIPVTAGYGWIRFRVEHGGFIQPFCLISNRANCSGYIVPAYHQDSGF